MMTGHKRHGKDVKMREHFINIKVTDDAYLRAKVGSSICFDLLDGQEPTYTIASTEHFYSIKSRIEKDFNVPCDVQKFWIFFPRGNSTYRPTRVFDIEDQNKPIGCLNQVISGQGSIHLYLEVEHGILSQPIYPLPKLADDVLVFFKLFNPKQNSFRYIGKRCLKLSTKPANILPRLREMAGIDPVQSLTLFEEISFYPKVICQKIELDMSFEDNKLQDVDILWVQICEPNSINQHRRHNVHSFLQFMLKKTLSLELYQDVIDKYALFKSGSSTPTTMNATLSSLRDELGLNMADHAWTLNNLSGQSVPCKVVCPPKPKAKGKKDQNRAAFVSAALSLPRGQLPNEDVDIQEGNVGCHRSLSDSELNHLIKCRKHTVSASQVQESTQGTKVKKDGSRSDSELTIISNVKVPTWVLALTLRTVFHSNCSLHKKNLDTFCISCYSLICANCDHEQAHKKLRVYKVNNRFALDLEAFRTCFRRGQANKVWGDDDINTVVHRKKMIYIHPCEKSVPSKVQVPGNSYCNFCSRKMLHNLPLCSVSCKARGLFREKAWKRRPPRG